MDLLAQMMRALGMLLTSLGSVLKALTVLVMRSLVRLQLISPPSLVRWPSVRPSTALEVS